MSSQQATMNHNENNENQPERCKFFLLKFLSLYFKLLTICQNSEGRSYEVTLKAGSRGYGRSGVTGSAGAYNVGARTRPQLRGCALAQEPGVLNFGLGLQTMEGDEYAETGR